MTPDPDFLVKHKDLIHKELDLIQDVIKRMAANSFQVKAWMAGIISFIAAFERGKLFTEPLLLLVLLVPILSFWYLDGFFLQAEHKYRNLYNGVIRKRAAGDLSDLYDLNPHRFNASVPSIRKIMRSKTLLPFYLIPAALLLAALLYVTLAGGAKA